MTHVDLIEKLLRFARSYHSVAYGILTEFQIQSSGEEEESNVKLGSFSRNKGQYITMCRILPFDYGRGIRAHLG